MRREALFNWGDGIAFGSRKDRDMRIKHSNLNIYALNLDESSEVKK